MVLDAATKRWMRNVADERAAANGCKFDEAAGQFVVDWMADYLCLYEGEWAGDPFTCVDWQYEATMRMFGWMRYSERWRRWIRRFTRSSIWVAKKNKKSPTLAAWGLYLLCGDGEQGQKVFFGAKDGSQARENTGKHAVEMVMASERLQEICTINKSLMQVTHEASRSFLKPISSSDVASQKAKEGINGSMLIDETHVVDRRFINRVERAGISRSEPFHIEVSTAGDNPDDYGKEQFDYGAKVEDGTFTDERMFYLCHAAPQDASDEDIQADALRFGKMANPAMGHTVDEEEFLDDCKRSSVSLSRFALFKQYRLNIWQNTSTPWLKLSAWNQCKEAFTADDLKGSACYAALDLSKTRDMTALVLVFRDPIDGETYRQLPFFWLPEATAKAYQHLASFQAWADEGYIELTPGEVCDYSYVEKRIVEIAGRYEVRQLAFDRLFANELTQRLEDDHGIRRVEFPQTITHFASPTAEYERLVIAGKLLHNGNPVLAWQAGHVHVKTDVNTNKRPVKPSPDDYRKIDGIVGGIMALGASLADNGNKPSIYNTRGLIKL